MRVVMLAHITGSRNGVEWPAVGEEIDLPDAEATTLIAQGLAAKRGTEVGPELTGAPAEHPAGEGGHGRDERSVDETPDPAAPAEEEAVPHGDEPTDDEDPTDVEPEERAKRGAHKAVRGPRANRAG